MNERNRIRLQGRLLERAPLRHTPTGKPALEAVLAHQSEQVENGLQRKVECEVPLLALGPIALEIEKIPVGTELIVEGFVAAHSVRRRRDLVLHIEAFELTN